MYKENVKSKNQKRECWERIEAVIKMAQMTTNGFARHIGLARGENLYQIKRGNNGVSFDVADRIVAKFPEVSKLWLLTGDGQMINGDAPAGPWSNIETPNSKAFLELRRRCCSRNWSINPNAATPTLWPWIMPRNSWRRLQRKEGNNEIQTRCTSNTSGHR